MNKKTRKYTLPTKLTSASKHIGSNRRDGKDIPHSQKPKRSGVDVVLSDKKKIKSETLTRDKEGHYIMIKVSIHQKNITKVNIYDLNIRAAKYKKQIKKILKGQVYNTIIVVEFNTSLSKTGTSTREKINKEILNFKYTLDQIDLTNIHQTFHHHQQNMHSPQAHREHFPEQITC